MPHLHSQYPKHLRDAAVQEIASTKKLDAGELSFDCDHQATPRTQMQTAEEFDSENWVAKYPGQICPHIGNGSGGPR